MSKLKNQETRNKIAMKQRLLLMLFIAAALPLYVAAQQDSITVAAHPQYDSVTGFHRMLLGRNYRKEWAAPTTLPVIRISEIHGGLTPTGRGGGHQSLTLRLVDKDGNEWAMRSVNKFPQVLLPEEVRETIAADVVDDAMSAQHPYSALIVPPIADAAHVPHTNPIIGYVAADPALGEYSSTFVGTVNLLEEREPMGESDNTEKMMRKLDEDNDNNFDSTTYFRARLVDVLINDWDRHLDQWRFVPQKNSYGGNTYLTIPRDRDQVFYINEGLMPRISTLPSLLFFMQDFKKVRNINDLTWESRFLNGRFLNQFTYDEWMKLTNEFVANVTDSVLEASLQRLPESSYKLRHDYFMKTLQHRRTALPKEMQKNYRFINRIVDLQTSDKNELVEIRDTADGLLVDIHKLNKNGETEQQLFRKVFDPSVTKEIRLYTGEGDDHVVMNAGSNKIKLRIIGKSGEKKYDIAQAPRRTIVYGRTDSTQFAGDDANSVRKHLSNDSANTSFFPTDLYNRVYPMVTMAYNYDDGFILGGGIKYIHKGFRKFVQSGERKIPWGSVQQLTAAHSFSTNAFNIQYTGDWLDAIGKADIVARVSAFAPNNTQNFFGIGNETEYIKAGDNRRYYRARFNLYNANVGLQWGDKTSITVSPAFQYYHFNYSDNKGRFILNTSQIGSYDSTTLDEDRMHAGAIVQFVNDRRDNAVITTSGSYFNVRWQSYAGLNDYSKSFTQIIPSFSVYQSLNKRHSLVVADRVGGGITVGKTAFYQSLFLDGNRTILGYRQFRFAGQYLLYNNLELHITLANLASYILPGELGLIGSYDIGRVWEKDDNSNKWHNGISGGIYFTPAKVVVLRFNMGYSTEGWFPDFSLGFRF